MLNFKIIPKYGLLIEYDLNGKIIKSWHDPTGQRITSTASAASYGDKLYIGSYYSDFIAVISYWNYFKRLFKLLKIYHIFNKKICL